MVAIKAVKLIEWSNKFGSFFYFYPFTGRLYNGRLARIKWKSQREILTSKILGITSVAVLDLLILMYLVPMFANYLQLDTIVFSTVMVGVTLIFSGVQLFMVIKIQPMVELTIQFVMLEEKYDSLEKNYGLRNANSPFLVPIMTAITIVPPFTWAFLALPAILTINLSNLSPIRKVMEYHEIWIASIIMDVFGGEGSEGILFGIKLIFSIVVSVFGFGPATFNCVYIIQIAILYVESTKARIAQLWNARIPAVLIEKAYMDYELANVLVNDSTAGVLAFFYFTATALITGVCFVILKYDISTIFVVVLLGILVTLVIMLVYYIQSSVEMKSKSKEFRLIWKYGHSRRAWAHKYWASRQDYKIWIGKYFTLEESNLILRIFGDFIVQNVIDLLITFH